MRKVKLNVTSIVDRAALHECIKEELDFPEYYGANLDALHDCLTEISEDTCIGIYEPSEVSVLGNYLRLMNQVFIAAEQENEHLCVFIFQKEMKFIEWN